jgi:hypothetical protein
MMEFQRLIATHAESRATLELTLGASAREVDPQTDLPHRKAGFQCASYTWGVHAHIMAKAVWHATPQLPHACPTLRRDR